MRISDNNLGKTLGESDLLPADPQCPFCGESGPRRFLFALQEEPRVDLLACRCGCASASRVPSPDVLRDYYATYFRDTAATATFDGSGRFARHLFRVLKAPAASVVRILDFGGGVDATLSRALADEILRNGVRAVEIALVDPNAACRRAWGATTVECSQTLEAAGNDFDIVLASAVVEHLPHPREAILALLAALKPGGSSYFRTPAVAAVVRCASRLGVRVDFGFPAHRHDMGQAFWERLPETLHLGAEFRMVRSRPSLVETEFSKHPLRTAGSHLFKLPWLVFGRSYTMVGGWEVVVQRTPR